jgi:hypothetical protein
VERPVSTTDDSITAALLQIGQCADRIGQIDAREGAHFREVSDALAKLHTKVQGLQGTVADQAEILASLDGAAEAIAELGAQLETLLPPEAEGGRYQPIPPVRWWELGDTQRQDAVRRLQSWVARIYRPHYGHLAAVLGECWPQHPLCLVTLDWLSELWSVLYLQPARNARDLAAQAEFATRILPAAAAQMDIETSQCPHRAPAGGRALANGAPS